jgi:hypothetical protein
MGMAAPVVLRKLRLFIIFVLDTALQAEYKGAGKKSGLKYCSDAGMRPPK